MLKSLYAKIFGAEPGLPPSEASDGVSQEPHPAQAPTGSLWAEQRDVDFFVGPALTMDTLDYLSTNGDGPEEALRERFGLPPAEAPAGKKDDADEDGFRS